MVTNYGAVIENGDSASIPVISSVVWVGLGEELHCIYSGFLYCDLRYASTAAYAPLYIPGIKQSYMVNLKRVQSVYPSLTELLLPTKIL